jgi:hypothetical protein
VDGIDPFESGGVDVLGPMSTCARDWKVVSQLNTSNLFPLDIAFVLLLPTSLSPRLKAQIHSSLDRHQICMYSKGAIKPAKYMTEVWSPRKVNDDSAVMFHSEKNHIVSSSKQLHYADFPINEEIARGITHVLSKDFGIELSSVGQDYQEFLLASLKGPTNSFRLALIASPWPHPASTLAPYFFGSNPPTSFRNAFLNAMAEEDLIKAAELALRAEELLTVSESGMITIGQVTGCLRSHIGEIWCPPSGWIDYLGNHSN